MTTTIPLTPPFAHNEGFAYRFDFPQRATVPGDNSEEPKKSPLMLLENGVPLGPGHAHHYAIRNQGSGRFSHWNDSVYFSASDNTDPNTNGRAYVVAIPSGDELASQRRTMLESVGADPALTFAVLRAGMNTNGSPLALYLNAFGSYRSVLHRAGIEMRDKVVLEIGSGPHLGTALAFLFHGARKIISNDIGKVNTVVPIDYARIIQLLAKITTNHATTPMREIVRPAPGQDDAIGIVPERFEAFPHTGAEGLALPDESVDLIVSTSVFEHVMKPREVIANTFRILKHGGSCIHSIDLRDHSNPLEPLGFLKKSREEYVPGGTENRVRASDFIQMFKDAGFEFDSIEFNDYHVPVDEFGNIDGMKAYLADPGEGPSRVHGSLDTVVPWVTEAERATFDPEFRAKSLQDLSILGVRVFATKR
jgi:SAM-dependent methyltransferase